MKPAATYIQRPLPVRAIQVPPAGSAPSGYWMASLQSLIGQFKYEFGKRGQLAILIPVSPKMGSASFKTLLVNPGEWLVLRDSFLEIHTDESFGEKFTEPGEDHAKLEAERCLHQTCP